MFDIWNRRYTGSKYKLSQWIHDLIIENCHGDSFCDIFAGTGVISYTMINDMKNIAINDFLYSNEIIYTAFFSNEKYDTNKIEHYKLIFKNIDSDDIEENYVSVNFGNKFFSVNDAKKIGYIREYIEENSLLFNHREKAILIASLLYSADKSANTVGHYDAYIKGHDIPDRFQFDLIYPYSTKSDIHIYREDANELAKKINADIVYIDPPYNSRQYSRFYHVLENIACWKKPELFGVALKPAPENMSEYCKSSAKIFFAELINSLQCRYIVVSYNNTYNSKSGSSKNKMTLSDIESILSARGEVKKFEKKHNFFNAGKTEFDDHKELIFIVEVK